MDVMIFMIHLAAVVIIRMVLQNDAGAETEIAVWVAAVVYVVIWMKLTPSQDTTDVEYLGKIFS